ncbi:MAG: hypothetical protein EHM44_05135, partial [Ignavibacteriales bacterium]
VYKNNPSKKKSLPENYVMSLLESKDGTFWVGTWGGGLCKFDQFDETFMRFDDESKDDDYIQCLYEDDANNIWYGTTNSGFIKLDPKTKKISAYRKKFSGKNYFPDDNITSITQDADKNLWIGTLSSGLFQFNIEEQSFIQFKNNPQDISSISNNYVWDVFNDSNKNLILSTGTGVDNFDLKTKKITHHLFAPANLQNEVPMMFRQVIKDHDGNMWAGTYNYMGLYLFQKDQKGKMQYVLLERADDDPNSLISNRIRWLYEDRSNNIWIGTEEGISKLSSTKEFIQYRFLSGRKNTLGGKVVSSIIGGEENSLWVGYGGGGFDRINLADNSITHFKNIPGNPNSLSVNDIVALYEDKYGILWIGTSYGGLNRFDPKTKKFKIYRHYPNNSTSIKSDWVQQILETRNGELLIGTNDGLQILDRKSEKFYNYKPIIKNDSIKLPDIISVNSLFEDKNGEIWIGTWLDGLFRYDSKSQVLYHYFPNSDNQNSISASKVSSIYEDSKGYIWLGTHSGGFNKFDKLSGKFARYTTRNGLPNDVVFGILEDEKGNLWISTMKGLAKFNPSTESFRIYDQSDGIISNLFNWHASYKDHSGKMYFGGDYGFISFYPQLISLDTNKSSIAFTSFKVFDKEATLPQSLPATKEIVLQYNQNFFSIEFASLDMAPAHKHKYSYMLEGIDPNWIQAESRTTAYYTDIEYGNYRFLVKAGNADNIWTDPIVLSIIIKPAWWMTWWFKILLGLALVFVGFMIYKFRVNQLLKIERIRYDIASDLHDEIGSNLSSICVDGQLLMKSNSLSESELELSSDISKTASQTLDAMRDIIWFINPKNDEGEDIIFKMRETAARLLVGMQWSFNSTPGIRFDLFSLEQRRNIFLIYKEALTNVIRHSKANKCSVDIKGLSDQLILKVIDEGEGFDVNGVKKNTGVLSMMKRSEKIKGKLLIESERNRGTTITLDVKAKM